jgi:hypothetical protein
MSGPKVLGACSCPACEQERPDMCYYNRFSVVEYMHDNPPPTHTGRADCQCRQCFFTEGKKGYWTNGDIT